MIEIRWHGRGGQGAFTAARLLGAAAAVMGGKYSLAFPSFGPERRGAPVLGFTKIDDKEIRDRSQVQHCNYIVILDDSLLHDEVFRGLKPGGIAFVNTAHDHDRFSYEGCRVVAFNASLIALNVLHKPIVNVAMFAALIAVTDLLTCEACLKAIELEFKAVVREKNKILFQQTYEMIKERNLYE